MNTDILAQLVPTHADLMNVGTWLAAVGIVAVILVIVSIAIERAVQRGAALVEPDPLARPLVVIRYRPMAERAFDRTRPFVVVPIEDGRRRQQLTAVTLTGRNQVIH